MKPFLLLFLISFLGEVSQASTLAKAAVREVFFSNRIIDMKPEEKEDMVKMLKVLGEEDGLFELFCNDSTCRIVRMTEVDIEMSESECSGASIGFIMSDGDYVISGFKGLQEGVFRAIIPDEYIFPDSYEFEFGGVMYELSGTGNYTSDNYDNATNVQLFFTNKSTGEKQTLRTYSRPLESTQPYVLFIGDLDGDGKPDFILEEGFNYEFVERVLYLSSMASKGQLVKHAGSFSMWRDC